MNNKDERIDDLQINDLKIIQNKNEFCFGIDSVLLSDFAKKCKKQNSIVDLCTRKWSHCNFAFCKNKCIFYNWC